MHGLPEVEGERRREMFIYEPSRINCVSDVSHCVRHFCLANRPIKLPMAVNGHIVFGGTSQTLFPLVCPQQYLYGTQTRHLSYNDFINKELILFSNSDNERSLPSLVDGMLETH